MNSPNSRDACALVVVLTCLPIWACGRSSLSAPTPTGAVAVTIQGVAYDSAAFPLAGATIEAAADATVAPPVTSRADGTFTIEMTAVTGNIVLHARKTGYVTTTRTIDRRSFGAGSALKVSFSMRTAAGPEVVLPGEYTVTAIGDCPGLPGDLRNRSYSATARATGGDTVLVTLSGPFIVAGEFGVDIAGSNVKLDIDTGIYETLPDHTYWRFTAFARTQIERPLVGRTVIPFTGSVEYCVLKSPAAAETFCAARPEEKVVHRTCTSDRHQLIFDRR